MPPLNWSSEALAAVRNKELRAAMTRLFEAYFQVAGAKISEGTLPLDLPGRGDGRYRFRAKFAKGRGWIVEAVLSESQREIVFHERRCKIV
jgi:hypothetical protein